MSATSQYTSIEGRFQFYARKGDYDFVADKEGYQTGRVRVSIGASAPEMDVAIELQRKAAGGASSLGPQEAVSAHQLSVPEKARKDYLKGMALLNSKTDYHSALAQFERAIHGCPTYYEAYAQAGIAHYHLGEPTAAEEALQKSVELSEGQYPEALFNLAEFYNNTNHFAEAEPVARRAIAAESSSSRGYYELSRALLGLKRPSDAEGSAQKARDLNPEYPLVYLVLTNIHLALHNYASMLQDMDAYLKLAPDDATSDQVRKTRQQVELAMERTARR